MEVLRIVYNIYHSQMLADRLRLKSCMSLQLHLVANQSGCENIRVHIHLMYANHIS